MNAVILFIRARFIAVAIAVLFVIPVSMVSAAPANKGGTDYDIPISELNKVKKKNSAKTCKERVKKEEKKWCQATGIVIKDNRTG